MWTEYRRLTFLKVLVATRYGRTQVTVSVSRNPDAQTGDRSFFTTFRFGDGCQLVYSERRGNNIRRQSLRDERFCLKFYRRCAKCHWQCASFGCAFARRGVVRFTVPCGLRVGSVVGFASTVVMCNMERKS